jgi:hypothetical protein
LDAELSKQVQDTIATETAADGFRIARRDCSRGQHARQGGFRRDEAIRLYRRDIARFVMRAGRVEVVLDSRRIGRLSGCLMHGSLGCIHEEVGKISRRSGALPEYRDEHPRLRSAA